MYKVNTWQGCWLGVGTQCPGMTSDVIFDHSCTRMFPTMTYETYFSYQFAIYGLLQLIIVFIFYIIAVSLLAAVFSLINR